MVFGVGGLDVDGATVERVRVGAEEGEVAFGEVRCHAWDGEVAVEHQESANAFSKVIGEEIRGILTEKEVAQGCQPIASRSRIGFRCLS